MNLNEQGLKERQAWEQAGYTLPSYDRAAMISKTKTAPYWIHFGAGNIFRAFQANVVQELLNQGKLDRGLIVAEGYDYEIIEKMNHPHDDYSILVTLKSDGTVEKSVTGSIAESLTLDSDNETDFSRLKEIFAMDSLQMASFTITEKGYSLRGADGNFTAAVASDMEAGPDKPVSYIGKVASLLYARFLAGQKPIAMVSMDNCSHNGDKLYEAISAFADGWCKNGLADAQFVSYIKTSGKVSFPWSMIDKITPRPDASIEALLQKDGIEELDPVITGKNTYVAPFVNAEECQYLVIEDDFPNGRPALEYGGIIFTDRETVDKVEKMKVCTCLNPLHTALAVFGCLLGYDLISKEMQNSSLKKLVELIGYQEGLPVVVNPGILNPKDFIDTVLNIRIPNPFMPDTPQRIATDTSQKLAIRFGETIKAYAATPQLDVSSLRGIPLVFAGWLRYLMGIDDNGNTFTLSPDPLLAEVRPYLADIRLGDRFDADALLRPLLSDAKIWGLNLYEVGMASLVCDYFTQMTCGVGAVVKTLQEVLS